MVKAGDSWVLFHLPPLPHGVAWGECQKSPLCLCFPPIVTVSWADQNLEGGCCEVGAISICVLGCIRQFSGAVESPSW